MEYMDTNPLFSAALGLVQPWFVAKTNFDPDAKELVLTVDFKAGSKFLCPDCGSKDCPVHDTHDKRWRHLDFFQHKAFISARVPRVTCKSCGVKLVAVPWARPGSGFTLMLEALVLEMVRHMPVKAVSNLLGVDDKRLWRVIEHYVEGGVSRMDCSKVRCVGIDETSAKRHHDYVTVFYDLDQRRLLHVAEGKDAETIDSFAEFLFEHEGQADQIKEVSSDMSPAFIKGVNESLPNASVTFDRFHVAKLLGDALDKVRREEWRKGHVVKGARYALLKNPINLTARDRRMLQEIEDRYADLAEAYRLKESFRDLYRQPNWESGRGFLKGWIAMARQSGLSPMIKVAQSMQEHWSGILHWFVSRVSNAVMEGLNSLIQAAKRKARGYRTHKTLRLIAYLIAGKLDMGLRFER